MLSIVVTGVGLHARRRRRVVVGHRRSVQVRTSRVSLVAFDANIIVRRLCGRAQCVYERRRAAAHRQLPRRHVATILTDGNNNPTAEFVFILLSMRERVFRRFLPKRFSNSFVFLSRRASEREQMGRVAQRGDFGALAAPKGTQIQPRQRFLDDVKSFLALCAVAAVVHGTRESVVERNRLEHVRFW